MIALPPPGLPVRQYPKGFCDLRFRPLAAKLLVDRYGDEAGIEAAKRADDMLEQGDMEGKAVWQRILAAVPELQSTELVGAVH